MTTQKVVDMQESAKAQAMRDHFLGWQCRLRQHTMRRDGGRPSAGMRPGVSIGDKMLGELIVLIVKRKAQEFIPQFQHMVRKTFDPADRFANAQRYFSEAYYQHPTEFAEELTALCSADSQIASRVLEAEKCVLHFDQFSQSYTLPCSVRSLDAKHDYYQFTYWHNHLFNPVIPPDIKVVEFSPDWAGVWADPPV